MKRLHNNTLQVTFDPLRTFAAAKARIASNAPERGRYARQQDRYTFKNMG
ncbi:hypothetical protein [Candidatus Thiosymbion oneisti]|nr:hypothetical protein [Candidatus Thiosymbion oneisti]